MGHVVLDLDSSVDRRHMNRGDLGCGDLGQRLRHAEGLGGVDGRDLDSECHNDRMKQKVIERMYSPDFSQVWNALNKFMERPAYAFVVKVNSNPRMSVLTLACGHLWSWNKPEAPPEEIDCIHCEKAMPQLLDTPELRNLDLAVRNLRRRRHGLEPL